jgi:hydrogenase maturation protein HypF
MLSRRRSASVSTRSLEAQAAIDLEALAAPEMHRARESYCGRLVEGEPMRLDWSPLWRALLADLEARIEPPLIAAKFHAGMADTVAEAGAELARRQGCNAIVLCGGVFQNKLFLERVSEKAGAMGFKVLSPAQFPAGDGGIALGQAIRPVCAVARMSPAILTVARAARHKANTERRGLLVSRLSIAIK